jgi:hypothetical protein
MENQYTAAKLFNREKIHSTAESGSNYFKKRQALAEQQSRKEERLRVCADYRRYFA